MGALLFSTTTPRMNRKGENVLLNPIGFVCGPLKGPLSQQQWQTLAVAGERKKKKSKKVNKFGRSMSALEAPDGRPAVEAAALSPRRAAKRARPKTLTLSQIVAGLAARSPAPAGAGGGADTPLGGRVGNPPAAEGRGTLETLLETGNPDVDGSTREGAEEGVEAERTKEGLAVGAGGVRGEPVAVAARRCGQDSWRGECSMREAQPKPTVPSSSDPCSSDPCSSDPSSADPSDPGAS
eukprot:1187496-Prorocentrum_minimum.AAC.1